MGRSKTYRRKGVTFKSNPKGFEELMRSHAMTEYCKDIAEGIADRAGEGYMAEERRGTDRNYYIVAPTTAHAINSERKYNTLLKVMK